MTTLLQTQNIVSEELQGLLTSENGNSSDGSGSRARRRVNRLISGNYDFSEPAADNSSQSQRYNRRGLSTFAGVFCPVALSQFSTLLFLRIGFVVGQSGAIEFLIQLTLAYLILLLTVLSISAISTNGEISGGGVYFMISRTLGPEFGGSIGVLFYFANVFACGLYLAGLTEGLVENFGTKGTYQHLLPGDTQWWKYLYSSTLLVLCTGVCLMGSSLFARAAVVILILVTASLITTLGSLYFRHNIAVRIPHSNHLIYPDNNLSNVSSNSSKGYVEFNCTGPSVATFRNNEFNDYQRDYTNTEVETAFVTVFAVLFSSVTGIMNGANMSGELKQPSKSIPTGTLLAMLFTFTVYSLLGASLTASCDRNLMVNNNYFLLGVCIWYPAVIIGIAAATLSAALGNLIGASRVLAALAADRLFGDWLLPLAYATKAGNPIVALAVSFVLVLLVLLIGNLNTIAPIVSCLFLLAYASTNLSCAALDLASAPNFRPKFKAFHWLTSLLGVVGCLVMSCLISRAVTPASLLVMLVLMVLLHLRDLPHSWGSISQALIYHQVRKYLLKLDSRKSHVKYWRPQMLLLVSNARSSTPVIQLINDVKKGGLFVIGHVFTGNFDTMSHDPSVEQTCCWLQVVDKLKVKAFVELTVADSVRHGMQQLMRISGLGGMKPNTVCVGFYDNQLPVDCLVQTLAAGGGGGGGAAAVDNDAFQHWASYCTGESDGADVQHLLSQFPPLRSDVHKVRQMTSSSQSSSPSSLRSVQSCTEWCHMLQDALRIGRNLLVTRNMTDIDWHSILHRGSSQQLWVDAWLVNFMRPDLAGVIDTTGLLLLQFACVLRMVKRWKHKTKLRVLMCISPDIPTDSVADRLRQLLDEMRIEGETELLSWQLVLGGEQLPAGSAGDTDGGIGIDDDAYLAKVNECIRQKSTNTALSFICLPTPPSLDRQCDRYVEKLDLLTQNLPPTIMVYGVSKVFSRKL